MRWSMFTGNLSRFFVAAGAALVAASLTGCGGGGGSSTTPSLPTLPTAPSSPATPSTPAPNACSAVAGFFEPPNTIVNGVQCTDQQANRSSVVWLQVLRSNDLAVLSCSGTVIDTQAVLTAGHCLTDSIGVAVYMGTREVFITTTEFYVHPAYTGIGPALLDVAIVVFKEPLNLSVVPLLTSRAAAPGESAVIAGWGSDGRAGGGQTLRAGRLTVSRVLLLSIEVDYSSTAASICYGDSGGPLLISEGGVWAVAGVSSSTTSGCLSGSSRYGNVFGSSIKSFILKYVPGAGER